MSTIYKYPLQMGYNTIALLPGSQILSVGWQDDGLFCWALQRTEDTSPRFYKLHVFITGQAIELALGSNFEFIATCIRLVDNFTVHVFEERNFTL